MTSAVFLTLLALQLNTYVQDLDYPPEAIRRHEQGTVEFEIDVSPEGLPSACRIVTSSGSRALDERTCAIMRERPRFRPARDAEGRAVSDVVRSRIRWVLPGPGRRRGR